MTKAEVRKAWKASLPLDSDFCKAASLAIVTHLRAQIAGFQKIAIFSARPSEPDLSSLHSLPGIELFYPRTEPGTVELTFHHVAEPTELQPRTIGLLEPTLHHPVGQPELILVPGIAFDTTGARIGSGAGYYDRYFARNPGLPRWAVCFARQLSQVKLAQSPTDARMDAVVTEEGWISL